MNYNVPPFDDVSPEQVKRQVMAKGPQIPASRFEECPMPENTLEALRATGVDSMNRGRG